MTNTKIRAPVAIPSFLVVAGLVTVAMLWTSEPKLPEEIIPPGVTVPGEVRRHPDAAYLVRPPGVPFYELTTKPAALSGSLRRHLDHLLNAIEVASIGRFDGPAPFVLGEVGDVMLSGRQVHVLDVQSENVRVFSTTGSHLATFGGPGQGPGEFVRPRAVTRGSSAEDVWVADETRKLTHYSLDDGTAQFIETANVEIGLQDVCFGTESFVVHGLVFGEGQPLLRLDTSGKVLASFGHEAYASPSPSLNIALNADARIECTDRAPLVFYGSQLGEVRSYTFDGDLLWGVAITEFIWPDARELENERYAQLFQLHSSRLVGLTILFDHTGNDEALLVQVSQLERQDEGWHAQTKLDSYLLEPSTGQGGYVGSDVPLVVAAQPGLIATLTDLEYPLVRLLATGEF